MMRCFSPYGAIDRAFGRLPLAAGTSRLEKVPLDLPQVLALKGDVPVHGAESAPIVAASGRGLQRQGPLLERRTLDRPRVLPIRLPISFISSPALFLHQAARKRSLEESITIPKITILGIVIQEKPRYPDFSERHFPRTPPLNGRADRSARDARLGRGPSDQARSVAG